MALSFAQDIRPLFREMDIKEMISVSRFDLSQLEDVKRHANDIYARVKSGDMPCDAGWSAANVQKFKQWMDDGMQP